MRKQLKGNDDAVGKSVDMLQVRYESAAAEIERLSGSLREARAEAQEQCGACATACERTSASSGAALEKIQRTLASNRDGAFQRTSRGTCRGFSVHFGLIFWVKKWHRTGGLGGG